MPQLFGLWTVKTPLQENERIKRLGKAWGSNEIECTSEHLQLGQARQRIEYSSRQCRHTASFQDPVDMVKSPGGHHEVLVIVL